MFYVLLTFALLASGTTANKIALQYVSPVFFTGIRMFFAGIILLIANFKSERLKLKYLKNDIKPILIIAIFTTFIPSILKAIGLKYMISSKAALLGSLDPFITAILVYFLLNERLDKFKILGIIIAFCGILPILITHTSSEDKFFNIFFLSFPEICALIALPISRYGWILVQMILRKNRYSSFELNGITMTVSGLLSLASSYFIENSSAQNIINAQAIIATSYTIIIGNIIAYAMLSQLLINYSSTFVSLAGFSVPIFVYIYGMLLLKEPWSNIFLLSSAIILLGLTIFYKQELKHTKK